MSLFACASIHQGNEQFSVPSRGKQCSFMSLSVLLKAQTIPVTEWNSPIIDGILVQGDSTYLHSYNNDLIPCEGLLSLNNSPTVIDANYYGKSPVMIEAQSENQRWFIDYGKDHQGLIRSDYETGTPPYFTIHSALMNTFAHDNYSILILEGG